MTRFREGAIVRPQELLVKAMRKMKRSAAWLREQAAQAIDKTLGVSNGELLLESTLWPNEVAQEAHSSASTFKTTSDEAGALRHAPAYIVTFTHVTTSAHMPAMHNTPYEDAYREAGECIINPTPGFEYRPPAQPVNVTSSIMLNHAEDDGLRDRRGGQHCESCEEDSGFGDCSGDSTSDGRVSPEASEKLPTRRLPVRPPTRWPSVERPAGRKRSKRKAKPKISPADTGGRDADLVSADTPMDPVARAGLSAKSADAPIVCLSQADESTMSADIPEDVPAAPEDVPAPLEGMLSKPEDVTATADTSDGVADTSDNVADFSDDVADAPGDVADSPEDRQAGIDLPLSALQAGAEEEDQLEKDAATTTRRRAAPSSSVAVASPSSLSTTSGGDSGAETVVAAREAVVPTGWMAAEDKQLEDEKERQPKGKMEKQHENKKEEQPETKKEKRLDKEKQLEDERKQRLEEEQKLFMVKEEKKKRIQGEEKEQWTNSRSMTPPLSRSRSSHTSTRFQGCRSKVKTPDPTMHGMVNCCSRMSGWPQFDETFKNYPAFKREWERFQQLIPQSGLVRSFRENCVSKEIAHRIRRLEMMPEVWER